MTQNAGRAISKKRAFTLIELLVVMVIIGILIALFVVVAQKVRQQAYISGCASNLRQIGVALLLYADEHNNSFPPQDDDLRLLYPSYIDDLNVFACPATHHKLTDPSQIMTIPPDESGIGMDYEYRGSGVYSAVGQKLPSLIDAESKPTSYLLAWDSDNKGLDNQVLDKEDNHGALGGNKLFSDGSVRWFPKGQWGFGE